MFIILLSTCTIGSFSRPWTFDSNGLMKYVSLNNQPCQAWSTIVSINSNQFFKYQFTVIVNKCGGSCNTINDPFARVCVRNEVKTMNVKVFNLMSGVNKTKLVQHELSECKCLLNESIHNSK